MPRQRRPRNDPRQYDDLAAEWWRPRGAFAALHWLAEARGALIPRNHGGMKVLVDVACGGGLLAPHVPPGYRHVGVDIGEQAPRIAREHGVSAVRGDATALPLADESADVVVAGEVFEHLPDLDSAVGEIARVLKPGGTMVCDTLNDTKLAKLLVVSIGERLPGVAPAGIHDPDLFVSPERLTELCAKYGLRLRVRGLRPSVPGALLWRLGLRRKVVMLPIRRTDVVYQGVAVKER